MAMSKIMVGANVCEVLSQVEGLLTDQGFYFVLTQSAKEAIEAAYIATDDEGALPEELDEPLYLQQLVNGKPGPYYMVPPSAFFVTLDQRLGYIH